MARARERLVDDRGRRLSAQGLADRCAELGHPLDRSVIAKLEKGIRQTVSVADLLVLAKALDLPPLALVFPVGYEEEAEVLPGRKEHPVTGLRWASGEGFLPAEGEENRRAESNWAKTAVVRVRQFLRNEAVWRRTKGLALDQRLRGNEEAARATMRLADQQWAMINQWRQEAEASGLVMTLPPLHGEVMNFLIDPENPRPSSFD